MSSSSTRSLVTRYIHQGQAAFKRQTVRMSVHLRKLHRHRPQFAPTATPPHRTTHVHCILHTYLLLLSYVESPRRLQLLGFNQRARQLRRGKATHRSHLCHRQNPCSQQLRLDLHLHHLVSALQTRPGKPQIVPPQTLHNHVARDVIRNQLRQRNNCILERFISQLAAQWIDSHSA